MRKLLLSTSILLLLANCSSTKTSSADLLQGTWIAANKEPLRSPFGQIAGSNPNVKDQSQVFRYDGFSIIQDRYDYFDGFYDRKRGRNQESQYFGHLTDFKVAGGSLYYYNPIKKGFFFKGKIESLTRDELVLVDNENNPQTYLKKKTRIHDTFDRIDISLSPCYGPCPVFDLTVSKDGSAVLKAERHLDKKDTYKTAIPLPLVDYLFSKFEQQPILKYKTRYAASHTDDQTVTLKFYRNGKLVKTITDYGSYSPQELLWAIQTLKFLHLRNHIDWINTNPQ
ncbi:MAG: DUF6438 domain-containing protein [Nonlabens sp.]